MRRYFVSLVNSQSDVGRSLISQRYSMDIVTSLITICFVSKYFIIFIIFIKKKLFYFIYFFQLRVQTIFLGVQCMLMHPRRTGPVCQPLQVLPSIACSLHLCCNTPPPGVSWPPSTTFTLRIPLQGLACDGVPRLT